MSYFADTASPRARGTLFLHACTKAMTSPIEWLLSEQFGNKVDLQWSAQPIAPNMVRAEYLWHGAAGSANVLASALRNIPHVRFEITEHTGFTNQRISFTPSLGIFQSETDEFGNVLVNEQQMRVLQQKLFQLDSIATSAEVDKLLGTAWDAELEPFRIAADGDSVRWLHRVG